MGGAGRSIKLDAAGGGGHAFAAGDGRGDGGVLDLIDGVRICGSGNGGDVLNGDGERGIGGSVVGVAAVAGADEVLAEGQSRGGQIGVRGE